MMVRGETACAVGADTEGGGVVSAAPPIADETGPRATDRGHAIVYLALLTLAGPFFGVVEGKATPTWAAACVLAAFVGCVVLAFLTARHRQEEPASAVSPARRRLHIAAVMALVPLAVGATLAFGADWLVFFAFVSITAVLTVPIAWAPRTLIAVAALVMVTELGNGLTVATAATGAVWAFAAAMMGYIALLLRRRAILICELRAAQSENARLAAADAVTEERLRIARDLHDLLGHSLSVIALKAELARRLLDPDGQDQARREVADVEQIARRALSEVREVVSGYRTRSLAAELDWARASLAAAGVEVTVAVPQMSLPGDVDDLCAWIVREAATNIVRHSAATHATIAVSVEDGVVRLDMSDDGVGAAAPAGHGSGLLGLQERVDAAGGRLSAGARREGGFSVVALLPCDDAAAGGPHVAPAPSSERAVVTS